MAASDTPSHLAERKAGLRDDMRRRRADIAPGVRSRLATAVENRLLALPVLSRPRTVMVFASFGSEIPTDRLIRKLAEEGHTVLLPIVEGGALQAVPYRPGDPTLETAYGPREPAERDPMDPVGIDVVLLPGLAFDRTGARLGYGGAYYDRYLPRLGAQALKVGIGFHQQLVEEVPSGPQDVRMDVVVTDQEVIDCHPGRAP